MITGFPYVKEGIGAIPFEFRLTAPDIAIGDFVLSDSSLQMANVAIIEKMKNNAPLIKIRLKARITVRAY